MPHQRRTTSSPKSASVSGTTTATSTSLKSHTKKRIPQPAAPEGEDHDQSSMRPTEIERRPLVDGAASDNEYSDDMSATSWTSRNQWILLALSSGGCAAFNGVFAKLTTTELTTTLSQGLAGFFGLSSLEAGIELVVRAIFFGLNLVFNGVMWALFTKALTCGNSTTQVSIINTSSNFVITAMLGFAIFSEALPPLWWVGAVMLIAGNVIIGRKEEGDKQTDDADGTSSIASLIEDGQGTYRRVPLYDGTGAVTKEDEDILDLELDEA